MGVIMSKEFHRAIDVDGSLKSKAWDFLTKLTQNADLTGLDLKIPQKAADRRVRTARVDLNHRAVLFAVGDGPEPMWLLAAIKPHDAAYAEAETLKLEVNPANGAMEVLRTQAIQEKVAVFRERPAAVEAPQVLPFTPAELADLGINAEVAEQAVRLTSEDEILDLAADLPEWQQQVLLDLATGTSLDDVRSTYELEKPETGDDPVAAIQRPTTRMQFVYLDSDDELRRMLEGDFVAWRTYLHPKQRSIAYRDTFNGPYRLAGGAGTGKTVVALHRAAHLARRPGARVLLCTFTRNLAANLAVDIRSLLDQAELPRVEVSGVDQMVREVVQAVDGQVGQVLGDREQEALWEEAVQTSAVPAELAPHLTPAFLGSEYRTVILAMPGHTREAYLRAKRTGRGVRLNRVQRAAVWKVVEAFERGVETQGRATFDTLAARAAQILEDPELRERAPRYDHVVVDEGQDLHAGHWRVLRGLVNSGPNDMFICEDSHQRIYGERLVLSRFGIQTRGRSRRLTLNYRTSRQNLAFALGVIAGEAIVDLDGDEETVAGYHSAFTGPAPVTRGFTNVADETRFVVETVRNWLAQGVAAASIAILARRSPEQERVRIALQDAGVPVELLQRDGPGNAEAVKIASMHRAKGTEFSRVVVIGAEARIVPLDFVFEGVPTAEHTAVRARERSLFYVACSRARDELIVTWSGMPSPFLPLPAA
ncbi:UvrD-helicase domain-containing protein [Pseudonocardia sp. H11422]|uniref:UvrD-helicase domain-containing protein n=1 Tax=Pseudonocardia sp. H11422 TaxID=2835866 RepID=UPI001BDC9A28|nr:UvrD-helicase domain-containing protein [Pseudonocardia sp. H11422]